MFHRRLLGASPAVFAFLAVAIAPAGADLSINATYVDGAGETWDPTRRGVVEQAITEWLEVLDSVNPADDDQINITFDFTNAGTGSYLGQWQGSSPELVAGDNRLPWENTTHIIHFNADQMDAGLTNYSWWDASPLDGSDQLFEQWDMLSVARHELGHALGFTTFYAYDLGNPGELYPWEDLVTGTTFDPGGINVELASSTNFGHVANSGISLDDLMTTGLPNGTRRGISQLDVDMLRLAYGYSQTVPEPSALLLSGLASLALLRRRR